MSCEVRARRRHPWGLLSAIAAIGAAATLPSAVRADTIATSCISPVNQCESAPIAFSRDFGVDPIGFDTGWVPGGSPIQVHLWAQLFAETHVALGGRLVANWPAANHPLDVAYATPGTPGAGHLGFHYGVSIGAQAKVQITVLGQTYSWQGDIPYIPQFDYQVNAGDDFDPWAFQGFTVGGSTTQQTLAQVSVTDFIGVNIPGLDGGFELDSYTELSGTYKTNRIVVVRPDGTAVEGGPILAEAATTYDHQEPLGAFVEVDVHPEGEVRYDGTLHLIPAFYVDTIGPDFSIPIVDIPIPFTITQDDWVFDPVRVHVPLPDIVLEGDPTDVLPGDKVIDFGEVDADLDVAPSVTFSASNAGEAGLLTTPSFEGDGFDLITAPDTLASGASADVTIELVATEPGDYTGTLTFETNDPDEPKRVVTLSAHVGDRPVPPTPEEEAFASANVWASGGGCNCSATGSSSPAWGSIAAVALGLAAGLRRRARARRSAPPRSAR